MSAAALTDVLGHAFRDPGLLTRALTHRSFGAANNERLEFVGDAVLDCVVALVLYERFPAIPEGDLSRIRANLVNGETLARLARSTGVGGAVRLGESVLRGGGADQGSILADALEALFGAVFLDGGFDAARRAVERVYAGEFARVDPAVSGKDPKTRLQEWLQARRMARPDYAIAAVEGEAHAQTFTVECRVAALDVEATGTGGSRRAAEQAAAAAAYDAVLAKAPR